MSGRWEGGWTVLLLRPGDPQSHRLHLARPAVLLGAGLVIGLLLLAGVAIGRTWESRRARGEVDRLQARIAGLEAERAQVRQLAGRLREIEGSYERLRRAMGAEVAASGGDVVLPALGAGDEESAWPAAAEGREAWVWPLGRRGFVTRSFGQGSEAGGGGHAGLDIAVPVGTYVRAAAAGVVEGAGRDSVYGFFVRIAHGDGVHSLYAHNSWVFVAPGDTVERLQVIGLSGSTGRSTAPHLHFEVEVDGETVDPLRFVAGR